MVTSVNNPCKKILTAKRGYQFLVHNYVESIHGDGEIGLVIGVVMGHFYDKYIAAKQDLSRWDEQYPGWMDGFICFVAFEQEHPPCSIEDLRAIYPMKTETELEIERNNMAKTTIVATPQASLKLSADQTPRLFLF